MKYTNLGERLWKIIVGFFLNDQFLMSKKSVLQKIKLTKKGRLILQTRKTKVHPLSEVRAVLRRDNLSA